MKTFDILYGDLNKQWKPRSNRRLDYTTWSNVRDMETKMLKMGLTVSNMR